MRCPFCNQNMYPGNLEANGSRIIWSEHDHVVSMKTSGNEVTLAKTIFRNSKVPAYHCRNCKKIIIDYAMMTDN